MIKTRITKDDIFGRYINLYFIKDADRPISSYVSKIEWSEYKHDGTETRAEAMSLEPSEAQNLMDSLWDAGLRPSEGSGSAGAMAATQKHLEDMRTLVFKIKKRKPNERT
jgi:hypothetical protein